MTHHEQFIIKVGDLLRNPWKIDTLEVDSFALPDIEWLTSAWVTGTLTLQGVTDGSVKIMIKELKALVSDTCDISGEDYERQVEVKNFDARFSSAENMGYDRVYDELFPLDPSWETINIYDFLVQSIRLQEPLVHIKPGNEKLLDDYESYEDYEENQEDEENGGIGNNNVIFH